MSELYNFIFNQRLSELSRQPDAPFSVASSGYGGFVRGTDAYQLVAVAKEGKETSALERVMVEAKRVRDHGFLPAELARAKAALLRAYESGYAERDKSESGDYAGEYVTQFLEGEPTPGIAWEYRTVRGLLPGVTVAEVNALGKRWITDRNRVVTMSAPDKADTKVPGDAELLAAFRRAEATSVAAYVETVAEGPLVPTPTTAGRVVAESQLPAIGVTRWTLSNGVKVILKPTTFKADEVLIRGWSPGGSSLVSDADYPSASLATTAVDRGGAGVI